MIKELTLIQSSVFTKLGFPISHLYSDLECEEYLGYNFQLEHLFIKFRKAKITPKKTGQFVTLWKRNHESRQTEPFEVSDHFDFYIILTEFNHKSGFFFFPKNILVQKQILSTLSKEGKLGFRVYTDWDVPENKQAEKTKEWQKSFFINLSDDGCLDKFEKILNFNFT